jgi:hypothetical protein
VEDIALLFRDTKELNVFGPKHGSWSFLEMSFLSRSTQQNRLARISRVPLDSWQIETQSPHGIVIGSPAAARRAPSRLTIRNAIQADLYAIVSARSAVRFPANPASRERIQPVAVSPMGHGSDLPIMFALTGLNSGRSNSGIYAKVRQNR